MAWYPGKSAGRKLGTKGNALTFQRLVAHLRLTPSAAGAASVHAAVTLPTSGTTTVTTGITQPDVPRNLSVVGNAVGIVGDVVVTGKRAGVTITETLALNGTTPVVGSKIFDTVTQFVVPVRNAPSDSVTLGRGSKLGLQHKLTHNTVLFAFLNNAKEGTAPTVAVSASALESNSFLLNSSLPGAQVVDIYYVV